MQRTVFLMHEPLGPPLNLTQTIVEDKDFLVFHGKKKWMGLMGRVPGQERIGWFMKRGGGFPPLYFEIIQAFGKV